MHIKEDLSDFDFHTGRYQQKTEKNRKYLKWFSALLFLGFWLLTSFFVITFVFSKCHHQYKVIVVDLTQHSNATDIRLTAEKKHPALPEIVPNKAGVKLPAGPIKVVEGDDDLCSDYEMKKAENEDSKRNNAKKVSNNKTLDPSSLFFTPKKGPKLTTKSTFRKVKTLNLHLREDHDIDPDTLPSNSNENIENEAGGNNAEELVAKSDENNAQDETEDNNMEVADEDVDKELDVSTSVDDLTDAVTAYQQAIEITPMIEEGDQPLEFNEQQQKEDAQDEIVVDEDGDTNEYVTDEMVIDGWAISDDDDPKLIRMTKLLKKSPYFKSRTQSCKRYVQTQIFKKITFRENVCCYQRTKWT